ncbi:MAG: hypothetical protein PHE89_01135 [Alphaproteobacteria bacterium]|nr:hypothetical protein [Alphaproteobacteria bacterium]
MNKFSKIILSIISVSLISACSFVSKDEEIEKFNEPRYTDRGQIELKVNSIEVVSEFTPTFRTPNVEHLFPISIEKTAKLWAKDRLKAVDFSSNKKATYIIKNASVTEQLIKSDKPFSKDRIKYKANLNVVLRVSDENSLSSAQTEIEVWRELTIPADTAIDEKEKFWNGMVIKLFDEFDVRMEQNIHQYLNMYVKNSNYIKEY